MELSQSDGSNQPRAAARLSHAYPLRVIDENDPPESNQSSVLNHQVLCLSYPSNWFFFPPTIYHQPIPTFRSLTTFFNFLKWQPCLFFYGLVTVCKARVLTNIEMNHNNSFIILKILNLNIILLFVTIYLCSAF